VDRVSITSLPSGESNSSPDLRVRVGVRARVRIPGALHPCHQVPLAPLGGHGPLLVRLHRQVLDVVPAHARVVERHAHPHPHLTPAVWAGVRAKVRVKVQVGWVRVRVIFLT
jgi:hypothetical protein